MGNGHAKEREGKESEGLVPKKKIKIVYLWSLRPSVGFMLYCEDKKFIYFANRDATIWEIYEKESHHWYTPNGVLYEGRMYPRQKQALALIRR